MLVLCSLTLMGQPRTAKEPASSRTNDEGKGAWIHGTVVSDLNGQPLQRAQVVLRPISGTTNGVMAETDEHGRFVMNRIGPGAYSMVAQRDGYLQSVNPRRGPLRLPPVIQLSGSTHVRDIVFRLRPWCVLSGKIKFSDAEPAVGAGVTLYREVVNRGRHTMQIAGSGRANDRGEYRIHGITPGTYIIAAMRNRAVSPNTEEQEAVDDLGRPATEYRYATTFYPSAQKLEDAVPVRIESGKELEGIDIDLKPVPAVRISGRVVNGLTGALITPPPLEFRRISGDGRSSIGVPVDVKAMVDGYEIKGVTAGPYLVVARSQVDNIRIVARQYLTVSDAPIDNLDLTLEPEKNMPGLIRFEDQSTLRMGALRVTIEPRSDLNPSANSQVKEDGTFQVKVAPGESYDVFVSNIPGNYYLKSVRLGNMDIGPEGISGSAAAATVPLEVTLSGKAGTILGRAYLNDGNVAGGASLMLVPDPIRGRLNAYMSTNADEYGIIQMAGITPGRYTLFAYYDEPPCNFWDETALVSCRAQGRTVDVGEAGQATVEIRMP